MLCLALLLLTTPVWTSASDEFVDALKLEPLRDSIYIFDVRTDASTDDVKQSFAGLDVRYQFKVRTRMNGRLITLTLYQIVTYNQSEALKQLRLPDGSKVTQYPVEHISDFFNMIGEGEGWDEPNYGPLPDENLCFFESEYSPKAQMTAVMKAFAENAREAHRMVRDRVRFFAVLGSNPMKTTSLTMTNTDEKSDPTANIESITSIITDISQPKTD
ncbi:hypothetical protein BaRGS_00023360 [Batillaria attramentaria]|uniref:Uncharacterized protein n=1 Tax=Batillaria attramentaria TaxID=370345 RepID=A0ABD0KEE5_9CAEN